MPRHNIALELACPVHEVFDFLARPANLVQLAPAEMRLELVQGPERLQLGSVVHWKARRMGVSQSLVNEVTAFEEGVLIVDEQRRGPFKRWVFTHRFETTATGTQVTEELTYDPPGGLIGVFVTADAIHKELARLFAYRTQQLHAIFR